MMNSGQPLVKLKATARQLLASGRPHEAQTLLESAENAGGDPEVWMLRGVAGGMAGDSREAERCLREAVRLQPEWPDAHFNLGHALLSQGELHAAARAFIEAIRLRPDYAQAIAAFRWTDRRRWGQERIVIEMEGGLRVVCPRSLQCATTYVLIEQEDWFEPEIKFLRRFVQPGMKIVDVGANHGVYTLTLAQGAGPSGHVWAFEPASEPAACLAESLTLNGLSNVTLVRAALSDREGQGTLLLDESPELNRLVESASDTQGPVETVPLSTLDTCADECGWREMDFLKLDAEGAEASIIEGGRQFLSTVSPLVMFEVQHGSRTDLDLVRRFRALGYESYRYVPGIGALVPWAEGEAGEFPQLNLFCARTDRAAALTRRGLLIRREDIQGNLPSVSGAWAGYANDLPCFQSVELYRSGTLVVEQGRGEEELSADYFAALDCYASSQGDLPAPERYRALKAAFQHAERAVRAKWSPEGAAALARIASEFGNSDAQLRAIDALMRQVSHKDLSLTFPLLPVGRHFDVIPCGSYKSLAIWFRCSVLETWERSRSWSSFWAATDEFDALAQLRMSGQPFTPEMERRWRLLALSSGSAVEQSAEGRRVVVGTVRNYDVWEGLKKYNQNL
jgi:FkbM family methyltransferase